MNWFDDFIFVISFYCMRMGLTAEIMTTWFTITHKGTPAWGAVLLRVWQPHEQRCFTLRASSAVMRAPWRCPAYFSGPSVSNGRLDLCDKRKMACTGIQSCWLWAVITLHISARSLQLSHPLIVKYKKISFSACASLHKSRIFGGKVCLPLSAHLSLCL